MQLSDGGWGWFSGYGEHASPHTTAVVVHGLQLARQNDVALPPSMLERGVAWLTGYQAKQVQLLQNAISEVKPYKKTADDLDALVYMVLVDGGVRNDAMLDFLYRDRTQLSVYAKAMFGLALEKLGEKDKLAMILQNIGQYVVQDDENQTAYLKLPNEGYWWYWYGSEIEADAYYLKLLARTDPKGELASRLVKYLLNNRKHATYWNSTRDTAFCIEALADYLKASGEDRPDMTVAISLDGKTRKEVKITPADLFSFDNAFVLEGKAVETGTHTVSFTKQGNGPLYFNAYLTNFTLEDPITQAGLEIKVDRKVYQLIERRQDGERGRRPRAGGRSEGRALPPRAAVRGSDLKKRRAGRDRARDRQQERLRVPRLRGHQGGRLRAGRGPQRLQRQRPGRLRRVPRRPRRLLLRTLARGKHSVSYRLRAEIPGKFHALPARAQAMYAPELKANSDEIQLRIVD